MGKLKVLLTGSSGYIGQNFITLYGDKYDIVQVDRKINKSIHQITENDFDDIDHIVHLAAISGISDCETDCDQTITDNVESMQYIWLLGELKDIPVTFASSQAASNPTNIYAFTKRMGERSISSLGKYTILRFANVYGGIDYLKSKTSVVANFLNAKTNNLPLIINGDGFQERDFIHVNDICYAINLSILNPCNDILDISNIADITKAKEILNFTAKIKFKQYILDKIAFININRL